MANRPHSNGQRLDKGNLGADCARWTLTPREGEDCKVRIKLIKKTPNTSVELQKRPYDGNEGKRDFKRRKKTP